MKLILEKQHIKRVIILQLIIISLLSVLLLVSSSKDSHEKKQIIKFKDEQIAEIKHQTKNEVYLGGACKDYVEYIRKEGLDLYWKNRETNDFYGQ